MFTNKISRGGTSTSGTSTSTSGTSTSTSDSSSTSKSKSKNKANMLPLPKPASPSVQSLDFNNNPAKWETNYSSSSSSLPSSSFKPMFKPIMPPSPPPIPRQITKATLPIKPSPKINLKKTSKTSKTSSSLGACSKKQIINCTSKNKICNKKTGRCNMKKKPKLAKLKTGVKCPETRKKDCSDQGKVCNEITGRCIKNKKTSKLKSGEKCPKSKKTECISKKKICNEKTGRCRNKTAAELRAELVRQKYGSKPHIVKKTTLKRETISNRSSISPLHAVNVDEKDFYSNICLLLKNIAKHKQIYSDTGSRHLWTDNALIDLDHLLPTLRSKKKPPNNKIILNLEKLNKPNIAYLGNKNIILKEKIGGGSYGNIYSGYLSGKHCAIKISKNESGSIKSRIEYHAENIIHSELFCNVDKKLPSGSALIPKPEFMCKYSKSKGKYSYMFGMETLDGNLYHFIKNNRKKMNILKQTNSKNITKLKEDHINKFTKEMLKMLRGICLLLEYLQTNYQFYHRDMHGGNIMFKKTATGYDWYLIDFGMSTMVLHGNQLNTGSVGAYSPFSVGAKGKVGHDIRLMVLSIISNHDSELKKMLKPELFTELNNLNTAIQQQFDDNSLPTKKYEWHRGYRHAFRKVETLVTEPRNFLEQVVEKYEKMYKL